MIMNYHDIKHEDMVNGLGIRTTLFCSGCSHKCPGCQNPQTWDENSGIKFDDKARKELFDSINNPWISGVTFSGGDPLYPANREAITALAREIKEVFPNKNIWLYTGFTYEEVKDLPIMKYIDVLVDGEYIQDKRDVSLEWRGSSNQRVINIPETIKNNKITLICSDKYNDYEVTDCGCSC